MCFKTVRLPACGCGTQASVELGIALSTHRELELSCRVLRVLNQTPICSFSHVNGPALVYLDRRGSHVGLGQAVLNDLGGTILHDRNG